MELSAYKTQFTPVRGYWFTSFLVETVKKSRGCFELTLDLGLTSKKICTRDGVLIVDNLEVPIDAVTPSEEDRVVILDWSGETYELVKHTNSGFYKLKAIGLNKPPTIEVNGVHMHRIVGTDPWSDAWAKVSSARVSKGNKVLDTCMGLGYTAIASTLRGASEVYTFEVDENVMWIASRNPWSHKLMSKGINVFRGDVTKLVEVLPDAHFDRVIHDPPRLTKSTGDLYSFDFYKDLFRVLRPGGILFHYTGEPHKHSNISVLKGIKERLERAGFHVISFNRRALGYIAVKPGKWATSEGQKVWRSA